jgi:hypothetical protein
MRCTDPCGRDLPCCNRCWAGAIVLTLPGSAPQVILEHPEISCGGHDCHMLCVPFGVAPKRDYRFVGTVIRRGTTFAIEVDRWCSTD